MCMNALLPELDQDGTPKDYRIIIDQHEYDKKMSGAVMVVCSKCEKEFNFNDVHIHNLLVPYADRWVSNTTHRKVWFCVCKFLNELSSTRIIEDELVQPFYYRYQLSCCINQESHLLKFCHRCRSAHCPNF